MSGRILCIISVHVRTTLKEITVVSILLKYTELYDMDI